MSIHPDAFFISTVEKSNQLKNIYVGFFVRTARINNSLDVGFSSFLIVNRISFPRFAVLQRLPVCGSTSGQPQ